MRYKGYEAIVEYDEEDKIFVGRVLNTRDVIVFEGATVEALESSFRGAVDDYLQDCQQIGKSPERPFSGRFNLRIPPALHRDLALKAARVGMSLNALVEEALRAVARS
jgi:predicted HicB family RNase H-like nuclease